MWFLRPVAFVGLVSLLAILLLYLFKRKNNNIEVSSTMLWQNAFQTQSAKRSFQRLRKSLLMFLQLLAALLTVFALAEPYITTENTANKYCVVIDNSLSMAATDNGVTRLDEAKSAAIKLVKSSASGSNYSVMALNASQNMVLSSTDDKTAVISAINDIRQTFVPVDYNCMPSAEEDENILLFSDTAFASDGVSSYTFGNAFDNCGIISLTATTDGENARVLGKVKNFGDSAAQKTVSVYVDGKLYQSKELSLDSDETKDVVFTQISGNASKINAVLQPADNFTYDDAAYAIITQATDIRVLISGNINPFLERALTVVPNVEVFKNEGGDVTSLSGYDLYIFDGVVPAKLPSDGQLMFINPTDNDLFEVGEDCSITGVTGEENGSLSLGIQSSFSVYQSKKLNPPVWADTIATSNETPLIFAGVYQKQHIAVIGFDLSNSDLPLKKDFPIFIYDIINSFFPQGAVDGGSVLLGETAELNISPNAEEVNIVLPSGETQKIAPPFPVSAFNADGEAGIYYLEQLINGVASYEPFAVNIARSDEQYFNYATEDNVSDNVDVKLRYNYDLQKWFALLAVTVLIAEFVLYIYKHKKTLYKPSVVLRGITILLILCSLLDIALPMPVQGVTTVFAIDTSDSMSNNIATELDFVNKALAYKAKDDYTAVATFGKNGEILSSARSDADGYSIASVSDNTGSNLQNGMDVASSLFKSGMGKRLVLLTDGSETEGDAFSIIRRLQAEGTEVKIVPYSEDGLTEVQISRLKVPEYITSDKCNAELVIESTVAEAVQVSLYVAGKKAYEKTADINIGENRLLIPVDVSGEGNVDFKAVIEPVEDRYYQNNTAYASSVVKSASKVLVLEYNNSGENMEALLTSSGISVDRLSVNVAPKTVELLGKYEEVILCDCPYYEMDEDFVSALESYVKNSAGGLLVTAGENSLAPGGYKDTVLENILPVKMELSDKDKRKDTAMIMVVDRSGSMSDGQYGVSKLELAKEAMVRSVETLDEGDSVGVLAFDDEYEWVVEPTKIGSATDKITDKIYRINDGGGTSILPAFGEAVSVLSGYDADSKHIILMTDGQGEDYGYDSVISKAIANGISVSTVAVGSDAATDLLQSIATEAGGRYYYTDEFTDLPKIFERETALSNKTYVNNDEFYPTAELSNDNKDIMLDIENVPALNGYIASDRKKAADVVLSHNGEEPVLAKWRYGLGCTAVFAADIQNQCGNWLATYEGQLILKNTVSAVMRSRSFDNVETDLSESYGKKIITVQTKNEAVTSLNATLTGENFVEKPVFEQITPGVFEATTNVSQVGNYVLNMELNGDTDIGFASTVISVPYSKEYDIGVLKGGSDRLIKFAQTATEITEPTEVFTDFSSKAYDKLSVSPVLLILALLLIVTELYLRRFKPRLKVVKKDRLNKSKNRIDTISVEDDNNLSANSDYDTGSKPEKLKKSDIRKENKRKKDKEKNNKSGNITSTSSALLKNKQKRENNK
jgi:Mg-chelatase subunit ChlD